jgi:hypothetical protein
MMARWAVTGSNRRPLCCKFSGPFMPTASLLFTGSFRCFGCSRLTFSLATVGHGSTGCRCSCSTFAPPFPGARVEAEALNVTALSRSPRTSSGGLRNAYLLHDRIAYDSYIRRTLRRRSAKSALSAAPGHRSEHINRVERGGKVDVHHDDLGRPIRRDRPATTGTELDRLPSGQDLVPP